MFGFLKRTDSDKELSRQFVRLIFAIGWNMCAAIAEMVETIRGEDAVSFAVNDDRRMEVSLALLATCLATLKGYSTVMKADRGHRIEEWCRDSIRQDYDLAPDETAKLYATLDEYKAAFNRMLASRSNPYGEITGIMLASCLGHGVHALCVPGTEVLSPTIQTMVGDALMLQVSRALAFWKGR